MNTLFEDTIEHYNRMIAWAKTQDSLERADEDAMYAKLGENWFSDSCPMCKEHLKIDACPLRPDYQGICNGQECCGGLWKELLYAACWGDWIKRAERVLEFIKERANESLLRDLRS